MPNTHSTLIIAVMALVTALTRFLPFWVFDGKRQVPSWIQYLGSVLPYSIMAMLVVYCLKDISLASISGWLPAAISVGAVVGLHVWKRNTLLSIIGGTVCYMVLIRIILQPGGAEMTAKFLLIQGIGFLGTALFFLSYQCKSNKNLFRVQCVSYVFYTAHLLALGAATGGISYLLNTLRAFSLSSNNTFLRGKWMCRIICALQLAALALTWEGWLSILPVAANIAATIGGYTYNGQKIRAVGMFVNSPLWIVYNILVGSWAGILDELVTEASMIISIIRYGWKNLDKVEN